MRLLWDGQQTGRRPPLTEKTSAAAVEESAASLCARAEECLQRKDYAAARQYLDRSLAREKTKEAFRMRGFVAAMDRDQEKALEMIDEALEIDEEDPETVCTLGDVYAAMDRPMQAFGYYMLAMQMAPQELKYKRRFLLIAPAAAVREYNGPLANAVMACIDTPGLNCAPLNGPWYALLETDPRFHGIVTGRAFHPDKFAALKDFGIFLSPYFRAGLKGKLTVPWPAFERLLTALRGRLLAAPDDPAALPALDERQRLSLAADVATYCFSVEYIIDAPDAEKEKAAALRARIEGAGDIAALKNEIAVYACYAPLYALANAAAIEKVLGDDSALKGLVAQQITGWRLLREKAATITALTKIEDDVSGKVRAQYEAFPYPAWEELFDVPLIYESCAQDLHKEGVRVLVAGCGTGHEALWIAHTLPQAEVLAVDLSRTSLAYAEIKREDYGTRNITFQQADILQLGGIGRTFDLISCGGVLHHMADPLAGWRVLTGLLAPGGLMRIGLYSEKARRHIVEAIKVIAQKGYPATPDGIRAFRRAAPQLLPEDAYADIMKAQDYYNMSMCRDLLFHVQEHRFDIPQIKAALDTLGLEFVRMAEIVALARYRTLYPDDREGTNIDNWDAFEKEYPDTFTGMYQFWCRKKEG